MNPVMRTQRLTVERLEDRCTPAGNVRAVVQGGDLYVTGDSAGNEIGITAGPVAGSYQVFGLPGTTVNGRNAVLLTGVNDDFFINLQGGDNALSIFDAVVPDDLWIVTYHGQDDVTLCDLLVRGNLVLTTYGGADEVGLSNLRVGGLSELYTGGGHDDLTVFASRFNGRFHLHLGGGNDEVGVADSIFRSRAIFDGDSGFDVATNGGGNSFLGGITIRDMEVLRQGAVNPPLCPIL